MPESATRRAAHAAAAEAENLTKPPVAGPSSSPSATDTATGGGAQHLAVKSQPSV